MMRNIVFVSNPGCHTLADAALTQYPMSLSPCSYYVWIFSEIKAPGHRAGDLEGIANDGERGSRQSLPREPYKLLGESPRRRNVY